MLHKNLTGKPISQVIFIQLTVDFTSILRSASFFTSWNVIGKWTRWIIYNLTDKHYLSFYSVVYLNTMNIQPASMQNTSNGNSLQDSNPYRFLSNHNLRRWQQASSKPGIQGWVAPPCIWSLTGGGFTTGISKLPPSASGETSRTSAIRASDCWKLPHSASPIGRMSTPSTASWTSVLSLETRTDLESLTQALSTSSSDASTCFVKGGELSAPEHDSDLSSHTCFVLLCSLRQWILCFSH